MLPAPGPITSIYRTAALGAEALGAVTCGVLQPLQGNAPRDGRTVRYEIA